LTNRPAGRGWPCPCALLAGRPDPPEHREPERGSATPACRFGRAWGPAATRAAARSLAIARLTLLGFGGVAETAAPAFITGGRCHRMNCVLVGRAVVRSVCAALGAAIRRSVTSAGCSRSSAAAQDRPPCVDSWPHRYSGPSRNSRLKPLNRGLFRSNDLMVKYYYDW